MLSPSKSREALPATSNYMSNSQLADYLTDLRAARAARVNNARTDTSPTRSVRRRSPDRSPERSDSRPLHGLLINDNDETLDARRREQEEVLSLRLALEKIDLEDEKSMFESARSEALELMLEDQTRRSDDPPTPSPNSIEPARVVPVSTPEKPDRIRFATPQTTKLANTSIAAPESPESPQTYTKTFKKKGYQGLAKAVAADIANSRRRISSGTRRKSSASKNVFPNAHDKIYEEPPAIQSKVAPPEAVPEIPRHIRKNPFARVKFTQDRVPPITGPDTKPEQKSPPKKLTKPPAISSRPNKPAYTSNSATNTATAQVPASEEEAPRRDSKDIRSDEIKMATSKKQNDKSPNLPQPLLVSKRPDRPIVEFKSRGPLIIDDTPPRPVSRNQRHIHPAMRTPSYPQIRVPSLPSIAVPDDIPSINVSEAAQTPLTDASNMAIPMISFPDDDEDVQIRPTNDARPSPNSANATSTPSIPTISLPDAEDEAPSKPPSTSPGPSKRPIMQHAATLPSLTDTKPHLPPRSAPRNPTLCGQCALPISGRVLSAAGERLHPECFKCHECSTNLECVAFYPEPDQKYYERIARIQQRLSGLEVGVPVDMQGMDAAALEASDGDDSLRYFCHLDFHELFSPRCKSCKTPIEGEVVVACGAEWHVGHFFCAQCGDPFDADKPFIEQDNYAWCVGCHTNRFSPKCKKCKKPVTDLVLNALDAEWHGECFCCVECGDQFEDGRFFLRGQSKDPVCVKCEDKRLKA